MKVSYEFDQSPVRDARDPRLAQEGVLGAVLTGLMVLLFLRDWRSALVVVLNIPLSLLAAPSGAVAERADGQPHDARRAGAGGRHPRGRGDGHDREHPHAPGARRAAGARPRCDATRETAVPRLLAMLCILAVFIPAFFMQGAAQSLFVPLALAVGFAMVASYLLSSTLVPVLCDLAAAAARARHGRDGEHALVVRPASATATRRVARRRRRAALAGRAGLPASRRGWSSCSSAGSSAREIFPIVDAGQFALRLRAPAGTRIEQTEQIAVQDARRRSSSEVGAGQRRDHASATSACSTRAIPINTIYLWTSGPEEACCRCSSSRGARARRGAARRRLRERAAASELPGVRFSFEPSDIVSRVMSFGSPTPVEVAVSGPNFADDRAVRREAQRASWPRSRRCATCSSSRRSTTRRSR